MKGQCTIQELLEAGAHYGHQRRSWNPRMARYIFKVINGICIIDLSKTMFQISKCIEVVKAVIVNGGSILFVGTKKLSQGIIQQRVQECGEHYVCGRWLGGMLTNLPTIRKQVKTLEQLERKLEIQDELSLTKKELMMIKKRVAKLQSNLSGILGMKKLPELVVTFDPNIAIQEAKVLGIPIMGLVDTNCDPRGIDYVIPCNDDSTKVVDLIAKVLVNTVLEIKKERGITIKPGNASKVDVDTITEQSFTKEGKREQNIDR